MRFPTFCFLLLTCITVAKEADPFVVKVTTERLEGNVVLFHAENPANYPQTLSLRFKELRNFNASIAHPVEMVFKPKERKRRWFTLTPGDKYQSSSFRYSVEIYQGDIHNHRHDSDHAYLLPFAHGSSHQVGQGYGGTRTHSKPGRTYAIDFTMPEGTAVHAARSGVVVDLKEDSSIGGADPSLIKEANYVTLCHDDGTFAIYSHLRKGGVRPRIGQKIRAGQVIGTSGNTGWSTAPHLHFEVFFPRAEGRHQSVPTRFLLATGPVSRLSERQAYTAHHR